MPRGQLDSVLRHLRRVAGSPATLELTDAQLLERYASCRDEAAEELGWKEGTVSSSVAHATILEDWPGLGAKAALGGTFERLPLFRA